MSGAEGWERPRHSSPSSRNAAVDTAPSKCPRESTTALGQGELRRGGIADRIKRPPRRVGGNMRPARCLASAACVLAATLGVAVPSAHATAWRRLAPSVVNFSSDGTRYVAWQVSEGSPIVVFDTRTGHRGEFASRGCQLDDQGGSPQEGFRAADGRFLILCGRTTGLFDVRTGPIATLPTGEYGPSWGVVGSRYVEGSDAKHKCRQTAREVRQELYCVALYDIATGVVTERPHSGVADLDRPGAPPVCARLRAKITEEVAGYITEERAGYSNGLFAEGTVPIRISRCRGRPTLLNASGEPLDVELSAGLLSWDTGHHFPTFGVELDRSEYRHGMLETYRLSDRRRRSFMLPAVRIATEPAVHDVLGYSTHTANIVFWIGARTLVFGEAGSTVGTSAVYATRL